MELIIKIKIIATKALDKIRKKNYNLYCKVNILKKVLIAGAYIKDYGSPLPRECKIRKKKFPN